MKFMASECKNKLSDLRKARSEREHADAFGVEAPLGMVDSILLREKRGKRQLEKRLNECTRKRAFEKLLPYGGLRCDNGWLACWMTEWAACVGGLSRAALVDSYVTRGP
jgi:hypothetical protein